MTAWGEKQFEKTHEKKKSTAIGGTFLRGCIVFGKGEKGYEGGGG